MSIARDISRQSKKQIINISSNTSNIDVDGGFAGSTLDVYLNGSKLIQNADYALNGNSGITLTQSAVSGDVIEFIIKTTSNILSIVDTSALVDESVTFSKLSNSATEADNVQKRIAKAWVNFNGTNNTIRADINVDTIADYGVGLLGINFTVPMLDINYVTVVSSEGPVNTVSPPHHCLPFINAIVGKTQYTSTISWFKVINSAQRADPVWAEAVVFR